MTAVRIAPEYRVPTTRTRVLGVVEFGQFPHETLRRNSPRFGQVRYLLGWTPPFWNRLAWQINLVVAVEAIRALGTYPQETPSAVPGWIPPAGGEHSSGSRGCSFPPVMSHGRCLACG